MLRFQNTPIGFNSSGGGFSYYESYSTSSVVKSHQQSDSSGRQLEEVEIEYTEINSTLLLSFNSTNLILEKSKTVMVSTTVEFFPLGLGLLILCTLGLLGNWMSAIVLSRPKMKSTYSILTLGLTFCDTVYLLTKLLRYGILSLFVHFSIAYNYREIFYPILGPHLRALTFTAHTGSTYFTVALAVDRYISVCFPIKAKFLCTKRRAYSLATFVFIFSIIYNIPRWMEFHTEAKVIFDPVLDKNMTLFSMEISNLRLNSTYKMYYIFWSYFIILFVLPFTLLTFFNFKIFRVVRDANTTRKKLTPFQRREISFATMILSIVAMFLICNVDYLVLDLLTYFQQPYPLFWEEMGNFLLTLNSAGNFIIYCVFGRKFRQEFMQITRNVFLRKQRNCSTISSRVIDDSVSGRGIREDELNGDTSQSRSQILKNTDLKKCKCKMKSKSIIDEVLIEP